MTVTASLRFEVFKRDAFTCQYCGRRPPDVVLHVDHIEPKSGGGTNELLNLITACADCNLGKGVRNLSDHSVLRKQIDQAADLSLRRENILMLAEWKRGLRATDEQIFATVKNWWNECTEYKFSLTQRGEDELRGAIRKFGAAEIMESIEESIKSYLRRYDDGQIQDKTAHLAFSKIVAVAKTRRDCLERPWLRRALYVRAVVRNRFQLNVFEARWILDTLNEYGKVGACFDYLENLAKCASSYGEFQMRAQEHASLLYDKSSSRDGTVP